MKEEIDVTLRILSAYLNSNQVSKAEMLLLIPEVYQQVTQTFYTHNTNDEVTCLCCKKTMRTLKKHLRTQHNLSAAEYRARFNLAQDHPITAKSFNRSDVK